MLQPKDKEEKSKNKIQRMQLINILNFFLNLNKKIEENKLDIKVQINRTTEGQESEAQAKPHTHT